MTTNDETQRQGPGDVATALSSVAEAEYKGRLAARPPTWFLLTMSIGVGVMVAINAFPPTTVKEVIAIVLTLAIFGVFIARRRMASSLPQKFAIFRQSAHSSIPVIVALLSWFAALVSAVSGTARAVLPWWGYIGAGIVLGTMMYVVFDWAWTKWVIAALP